MVLIAHEKLSSKGVEPFKRSASSLERLYLGIESIARFA
jgi:hypothetical protein